MPWSQPGHSTPIRPEAASWRARIDHLQANAASAPSQRLFELAAVLLAGGPVTAELLDQAAAVHEDVADHLASLREYGVTVLEQTHAVAVDLTEKAVIHALDAA